MKDEKDEIAKQNMRLVNKIMFEKSNLVTKKQLKD